jgi:hypothetical protein
MPNARGNFVTNHTKFNSYSIEIMTLFRKAKLCNASVRSSRAVWEIVFSALNGRPQSLIDVEQTFLALAQDAVARNLSSHASKLMTRSFYHALMN